MLFRFVIVFSLFPWPGCYRALTNPFKVSESLDNTKLKILDPIYQIAVGTARECRLTAGGLRHSIAPAIWRHRPRIFLSEIWMMDFSTLDTRNLPLIPTQSALLFIDVQNFSCRREGGEFAALSDADFQARYGWFLDHIAHESLPNMARLQAACRAAKVEVIYTVIENLTLDGRDRSLDYRITGFNVPKGSWDAQVLSEIAPEGDEMVFPKTSSNVFVSTHLDYVLRNMEKRQIVMSGFITDQCVSSAVRNACDLGYLVTVVTDACASYSLDRHTKALTELKGYCRQVTTDTLLAELGAA
jgi:ureidoacrylate peracid hydrolase